MNAEIYSFDKVNDLTVIVEPLDSGEWEGYYYRFAHQNPYMVLKGNNPEKLRERLMAFAQEESE